MTLKILSLLFSVFLNSAQSSEWPQPTKFDCNYYLELERHLNCKDNGSDYLTSFAYPYCLKFQEKATVWNPDLSNFINNTGLCLMGMLYDNRISRIPNCTTLEEFAFDSHAICYKQYGYCGLTGVEKLQVGATIEWFTFFSKFRQIKTQIDNVHAKCLGDQ
ncbi:MAG: hypothetical protein SGJ18_15515 [Pseudomonadota bacterium]|nr:hypothetical protein [Pseudomonadota bacterium]